MLGKVRPPKTRAELRAFVKALWGFSIPDVRVCPGHVSPMDAFEAAYFATSPVQIWKASRGFGGKSSLLATLALTEQVGLGSDVTIVGGSGQQSRRVIESMAEAWGNEFAPRHMLRSEPGTSVIRLENGSTTIALTASSRSVRGPHPQRMRADEIDEMDLKILEAAQGQPMTRGGVIAQTVMSSTHQYPDKTMSEMLRRAVDKGWPIMEWCYRETMEPHGWLPLEEVERKRVEMTRAMWDVEIELQEPAIEGRAVITDAVVRMFDPEMGEHNGLEGEYLEFEEPDHFFGGGRYVTGVDWAKSKDWTIITTWRVDCNPMRLVAFERLGRRPWPDMIERLNVRHGRFQGAVAHDATGLGTVVADYVSCPVEDIIMVGRPRHDLFSEYIGAIERDELRAPRVKWMYDEHRYCARDDLFKVGGHPPDSFVSGALAFWLWQGGRSGQVIITKPRAEPRERVDWSEGHS